MITLERTIETNGINRTWYHVTAPTQNELHDLAAKYDLDPEELQDIMDMDELSRFDILPNGCFIIIRLATYTPHAKTTYNTSPLGIFLLKDTILTISSQQVNIINQKLFRGPAISTESDLSFILSIMLRSSYEYLHHLKGIKRQTELMEKTLHKALSSSEIIGLLRVNKSLQYFMTSLRSNEALVEKLRRSRYWQWNEAELDLLEDVNIEHKEALEMALIYSKILKTLTDVFAIVINNNLNHIMKRLAALAFIIAIPTLVSGIYGMNVELPLQENLHAFGIIMVMTLVFMIIAVTILRRRKFL
jgi:magnesium transporter